MMFYVFYCADFLYFSHIFESHSTKNPYLGKIQKKKFLFSQVFSKIPNKTKLA